MLWEKELAIAKEAAIKAGKAILGIYHTVEELDVEYKSDSSPLTQADKTANRIIVDLLRKKFPKYAVLSEEETRGAYRD